MTLGHSSKRVAEYILALARENNNPLTPMQLLKLVFISHGWQLGLHGRPLVGEDAEAWQYGPVIPSIYHAYKRYGGNFITENPDVDRSQFDHTERKTLDQVWKGYGHRSGVSLSSLTHEKNSPWEVTVRECGLGSVIPNDLIEDYYRRKADAHS
jgi:uncharacterized phage-associated protein